MLQPGTGSYGILAGFVKGSFLRNTQYYWGKRWFSGLNGGEGGILIEHELGFCKSLAGSMLNMEARTAVGFRSRIGAALRSVLHIAAVVDAPFSHGLERFSETPLGVNWKLNLAILPIAASYWLHQQRGKQ